MKRDDLRHFLAHLLGDLQAWRRDALEAHQRTLSPAALQEAIEADAAVAECLRRLAALRERGEQAGNGMGL